MRPLLRRTFDLSNRRIRLSRSGLSLGMNIWGRNFASYICIPSSHRIAVFFPAAHFFGHCGNRGRFEFRIVHRQCIEHFVCGTHLKKFAQRAGIRFTHRMIPPLIGESKLCAVAPRRLRKLSSTFRKRQLGKGGACGSSRCIPPVRLAWPAERLEGVASSGVRS